jgi:hypothetical protein
MAALQEAAGPFGELGYADLVVPWPRPEGPFAGDMRTLEAIAVEALPQVR